MEQFRFTLKGLSYIYPVEQGRFVQLENVDLCADILHKRLNHDRLIHEHIFIGGQQFKLQRITRPISGFGQEFSGFFRFVRVRLLVFGVMGPEPGMIGTYRFHCISFEYPIDDGLSVNGMRKRLTDPDIVERFHFGVQVDLLVLNPRSQLNINFLIDL